jgi:transcriptional regulator
MYVPAQFREEDVPTLHTLIREHSLATLVTWGADGLEANHIPMEIEADPLPYGTLRGHVARANPVWQSYAKDVHALAIFVGPQTYITPSWYKTKRETGKVVPTWNYAVVHAHGPLGIVEDRTWLYNLVSRLTRAHEEGRQPEWAVTDAPTDFIDKQLGGIVGIEIPIVRLEGKWKVSQNREPPDRAGVVSGLRADPDGTSQSMANLVETTLNP